MGNNISSIEYTESKDELLKRLRRIEGQIKGIHKMVDEDKQCVEILTQVAAARAAINKVGGIILQRYSKTCFKRALKNDSEDVALNDLLDTIQKFLRFVD